MNHRMGISNFPCPSWDVWRTSLSVIRGAAADVVSQVYIPKRRTLIQVLHPLKIFSYLNMHEQVAKSLVYALAGGSTCMSVRFLGI